MAKTKGTGFDPPTSVNIPMGKKYIFGIGINDYRHWSALNNAVGDVEQVIAVLLERYDFDTLSY